jgi:AcrR family transcriptional regulator
MKRKNVTTHMIKGYISDSLLLLMAKKDYASIAIGEITDKAGVNRSTYYRNFASKEDIIEFFFTKIMREYLGDYEQLADRSEASYLLTIFSCFYKHKSKLLLIHKSGLSYLFLPVLNRLFEKSTETHNMSSSERYKRYFHTGGIYNTFILWFTNEMEETPEEMTEIAIACFPGKAVPMLLA